MFQSTEKRKRVLAVIVTIALVVSVLLPTASFLGNAEAVPKDDEKVKVIQPEHGKITLQKIENCPVEDEEEGDNENTGSAGSTCYHYKITPDKGYSVYAVYVNGKKKGRSTKVILKNPAEGTELKAEMGFRVRLKDPQKLCRLKKKDFIVKIGGSKTIKLQPKIGRKITYVNINGKKKYFSSDYEQKVKLELNNIKEATNIRLYGKRAKFSIMLDAGHKGYENRGILRSYWESKRMWAITEYEYKYWKQYKDVVVNKTRMDQNSFLDPYLRGVKGRDYDLVISNHSNSGGSRSTDYPLVIIPVSRKLNSKVGPLAAKIAATLRDVMETKNSYQIWKRAQSNGLDWFGFTRGASFVRTPSMLIEHSFHSNPKICKWLMSNTNLKKLAERKVATIAEYYGIEKKPEYDNSDDDEEDDIVDEASKKNRVKPLIIEN